MKENLTRLAARLFQRIPYSRASEEVKDRILDACPRDYDRFGSESGSGC